MSWLIIGTVPETTFPLIEGTCTLEGRGLRIADQVVPVARGTPALIASAFIAARSLEIAAPRALLVGDIGEGRGCARLYRHLVESMPSRAESLLIFHYLQPDVDWHNRVLIQLQELVHKPLLVADAGYMYVAKMSGFATCYDLFTPDIGELAFLADEMAPHPFYTRGFILQEEDRARDLISRAYAHENASQYLLVKGKCDMLASSEGILAEICQPCVENMEPIGGTGDTLTGLAGAFLAAGYPISDACRRAAVANRQMGLLAQPSPASSIADLLAFLPQALASCTFVNPRLSPSSSGTESSSRACEPKDALQFIE